MFNNTIDLVKNYVDLIQGNVTVVNTIFKPDNNDLEKLPILSASKILTESVDNYLNRTSELYKVFQNEISESITKMVNSLNLNSKTNLDIINNFYKELDTYKKEGEAISKPIDEYLEKNHKKPRLCFRGGIDHSYEFDVELINKYPGSYFMELYKDPSMWMDNGDIYIDHNDDNYEYILKYMKNDETLIDDVKKMDSKKRNEFVNDLDFMSLPVKVEYMNELCFDDDKMKMEAWKKRVIMVNGKNAINLNMYLKKNGLFDMVFNKNNIENIKYYKNNNVICVNMNLKYGDFIEDYCMNHKINEELIKKEGNGNNFDDFEDELKRIGIELKEEEKKSIIKLFDNRLLRGSLILLDKQYDTKLQEWLGYQYQWKLIYKASEHNYTAASFHEYCDNKGPTLIIIKSSEGWIFGGYTSVSWKYTTSYGYEYKDDSNAFIFTLKNPHNIPPTKYNKRKESKCAIRCYPNDGPVFGDGNDIYIPNNCNQSKSCYIYNDGNYGYECNSQYRKSLFVNTAGPDQQNNFAVSDYEVYTIND